MGRVEKADLLGRLLRELGWVGAGEEENKGVTVLSHSKYYFCLHTRARTYVYKFLVAHTRMHGYSRPIQSLLAVPVSSTPSRSVCGKGTFATISYTAHAPTVFSSSSATLLGRSWE